jgi:hypothetical protein
MNETPGRWRASVLHRRENLAQRRWRAGTSRRATTDHQADETAWSAAPRSSV